MRFLVATYSRGSNTQPYTFWLIFNLQELAEHALSCLGSASTSNVINLRCVQDSRLMLVTCP